MEVCSKQFAQSTCARERQVPPALQNRAVTDFGSLRLAISAQQASGHSLAWRLQALLLRWTMGSTMHLLCCGAQLAAHASCCRCRTMTHDHDPCGHALRTGKVALRTPR